MGYHVVLKKDPGLDLEADDAADQIFAAVTDCRAFAALRMKLDVTRASGTTPTLDVTLEHSPDGSTWSTLGTFAQKTAVSSEQKVFGPCHRYVRVKHAITGTGPLFRYTVSGEGV